MAQLVRLEAQDADAASSSSPSAPAPGAASVFVRCWQKSAHQLQLLLAEGDTLWTATVSAAHKPAALACSGADFLRALETAFSGDGTGAASSSSKAFTYKWSRASGVLTLMEPTTASAFAMKYASLPLEEVRAEKAALWSELLRDVVSEGADAQQQMTCQRRRLAELETLLRDKDAVLDAALRAKQQLEDQLFGGFCAVLNAKKDEIRRLQHELAVVQVQARAATAFADRAAQAATKTAGRKPRQPGRQKATANGAKQPRKITAEHGSDGGGDSDGSGSESRSDEVDDDDDDDASDSHDPSAADDGDGSDGNSSSRRRRAKRGAIGAYSQLPSPIRSSSQACTADDVLSDLDAIMKDEVAADDDEMQRGSSRSRRPRGVVAPPAARAEKKRKSANTSSHDDDDDDTDELARRGAKKPHTRAPEPRAAPAPVVKAAPPKAVDSEEEDILDMLA